MTKLVGRVWDRQSLTEEVKRRFLVEAGVAGTKRPGRTIDALERRRDDFLVRVLELRRAADSSES